MAASRNLVMLSPRDAERALAAWREHDTMSSIHPSDRDAIRATDAARALVLELLVRPGPARDLYNACARLGRLLADAGASPSLAASTIDGAARALGDIGAVFDDLRVGPARASLLEGFVAVLGETERAHARRAWEYPACAVRIGKDTVAIAAGHPDADGEALADWAARVALAASRDGHRQAVVSGAEGARAELVQALGLVGITVVDGASRDARDEGRESKGWLSFLRRPQSR